MYRFLLGGSLKLNPATLNKSVATYLLGALLLRTELLEWKELEQDKAPTFKELTVL